MTGIKVTVNNVTCHLANVDEVSGARFVVYLLFYNASSHV